MTDVLRNCHGLDPRLMVKPGSLNAGQTVPRLNDTGVEHIASWLKNSSLGKKVDNEDDIPSALNLIKARFTKVEGIKVIATMDDVTHPVTALSREKRNGTTNKPSKWRNPSEIEKWYMNNTPSDEKSYEQFI